MTVVNTATDVTITYTATPANWWENNAQLAILNFDQTKTSVQFTFTGVASQEYVFKIEGPGGVNKEVSVVATGSSQVLSIDLSTFTEAQRDVLNLIVVFAKTTASSGSLVITNIQYN